MPAIHDRDHGADDPALVVDRVHHLRHPMAFRLGRKLRHQESDADRADHGDQDDERPPGARRGKEIGVVAESGLTKKQQVVYESDQIAKSDGAETGNNANDQGEK
jgi:hypothetical protein